MKISDINNISIKWKLIIPFLLLAFLGTFSLIFLSIRFQEKTFLSQEKNHLECLYKSFLTKVSETSSLALALAKEISLNTCLKKALNNGDVQKLKKICGQSHQIIRGCFKFLGWRFFLLDKNGNRIKIPGNDIKYASPGFLVKWFSSAKPASGVALAKDQLIIWGAAPVSDNKNLLGAVIVIVPINRHFLSSFSSVFQVDYTIVKFDKKFSQHDILAASNPNNTFDSGIYARLYQSDLPFFSISPKGLNHRAIFITLIKDFWNKPVAYLEIAADRTHSLQLLAQYKKNMLLVGLTGLILSFGIIFWITIIFTRPIGKLVKSAQEIAAGKTIKEIKLRYRDEIGILADSLNEMLKSLEESHRKIRDYAENLEKKVRERTRALTASEEKYRTLVENVPLVVYRTDPNGSLTFVNKYIEKLLGFSQGEVLSRKDFLLSRIVEEDKETYQEHWKECLENATGFEIEYRMLDRDEQIVYVVDHAIPEVTKERKVRSVDGIIVDVTDRRKAQEKILQAEELKALREISARLAHEIRNPLTVAGGFARQLLKNTPPEDPTYKKLEIISSEIERLENILKTTLEYIKPQVLIFKETDLNALLEPLLLSYKERFSELGIEFKLDLDHTIPLLRLDPFLFTQVIKNILDLLASFLPRGAKIKVQSYSENNYVILVLTIIGTELKKEKLEPLLSPFSSALEKELPLGLPLTKIIIEKHNGLLKIEKLGKQIYSITISLPLS